MKPRIKDHHSGYLRCAFRQTRTVRDARSVLSGAKYDLLVGTGMSGALVVPVLAYALRKRFAIVRKESDTQKQNHSDFKVEGQMRSGDRWLFVDDFISSGATYRRVYKAMQKLGAGIALEHIGMYLYHGGLDDSGLTLGDHSALHAKELT